MRNTPEDFVNEMNAEEMQETFDNVVLPADNNVY